MKKVFVVLAAAVFLVSCDNAADTETTTKDSLDSIENAKKSMIDSTADQAKDSVDQTIDAQKNMVDSMNKTNDTTNRTNQ